MRDTSSLMQAGSLIKLVSKCAVIPTSNGGMSIKFDNVVSDVLCGFHG